MPIIAQIGRKNWKVRAVIGFIYLALICGGITMVYPFLLIVSGAVTNRADMNRQQVIQPFWRSEDAQFTKYLAEKYPEKGSGEPVTLYYAGETRARMDTVFADPYFIAHGVPEAAEIRAHPERYRPVVEDWYAFAATQPPVTLITLFDFDTQLRNSRFLRARYLAKAHHDYPALRMTPSQWEAAALTLISDAHGLGYVNFPTVPTVQEPIFVSNWLPDTTDQRLRDWLDFKTTVLLPQCPDHLMPVTGRMLWYDFLTQRFGIPEAVNQACGTTYKNLYDVPFPPVEPAAAKPLAPIWRQFLTESWPAYLMAVTQPARYNARWAAYLRDHTGKSFTEMLGIAPTDRLATVFPATAPVQAEKGLTSLWIKFLREEVAFGDKAPLIPEQRYADFLRNKYGALDRLPAGYGRPTDFAAIAPPIRIVDFYEWSGHKRAIFTGFLTHNFTAVFAFIATRGRALPNTVVLVLLTLLTTLIVNPVAAYALSRYRLKQTQQILLFLIATMAFPAEISAIPNFLLMRDLHLLNTYWALIIPGMANGFSIFLLKGFFDSLPQELYESAALDGAGEYIMFTQICLPLTTPILAVTALNAFAAAYSGWAWAMLSCQKPEMWTLMVWLMQYQLGWEKTPALIMASLVIAAIPMLLMFLFAQNIIMRGVIVPEMK